LDDTTAFLEAELADFSRYYPKNPKIQGEINAKVDELLQMGFIEHSKLPHTAPPS